MRRLFEARRGVMLAVALLVCPALALAQAYPTKPVRFVVPFPAGGLADLVGRICANTTAIVATAQFRLFTGTDITHVPYKGDASTTLDLAGGRLQMALREAGIPQD
jgi:tripartite-type tricarboxylate transporter receptor subunit TctC